VRTSRHVAPVMHRVNAILDEVKSITRTVHQETERADHAIRSSVNRVNETADNVRSRVRSAARRVAGVVEGARAVVESILDRHPGNGHAL
jgi:methyl-accepting chemotaxis protein